RRRRPAAAPQVAAAPCPPGRAAHRVEGTGTVAGDEADHQAGCALPGRSAAIARVRDEVTGEDRYRLSGQALVAPEGPVVDQPDLPHRAVWKALLELGPVGRQDRVVADEAVEGR